MDPVYSDQHWFAQFIKGNERAFAWFFDRHSKPLKAFLCQIVDNTAEAEDIVMVIFMKLWRRRTAVESPEHLKSLLFVMARNDAVSVLRSRATLSAAEKEWLAQQEVVGNNVDARMMKYYILDEIRRRAADMPPMRARVYDDFHRNEYTFEEIADMYGITVQTVRNHLSQAAAQLRARVARKDLLISLLFLIFELLKKN